MDLLHTTALSNIVLFGSYTIAVTGSAFFYAVRTRRKAAERVRAALDTANEHFIAACELYVEACRSHQSALAAQEELIETEAMLDELKVDFGDLSQELAAAKVEMVETNAVCDAFAKQCQRTDDVVNHLTGILNSAGIAYLSTSDLVEAQTESLIRVGLRKELGRGPGTLGRASDLEEAA